MLLQSAFRFSLETRFTQTGEQASTCSGILRESVPFRADDATHEGTIESGGNELADGTGALPLSKPNLASDFDVQIESTSARFRSKQSFGLTPITIGLGHVGFRCALGLACLKPELAQDFGAQIEPWHIQYGAAMPLEWMLMSSLPAPFSPQESGATGPASTRSEVQNLIESGTNRPLEWPLNATKSEQSGHQTEVSPAKFWQTPQPFRRIRARKPGAKRAIH